MTVRKVTKQKGEATRRYQVIFPFCFVLLTDLLCLLIAVYSVFNNLLSFFTFCTLFNTCLVSEWK